MMPFTESWKAPPPQQTLTLFGLGADPIISTVSFPPGMRPKTTDMMHLGADRSSLADADHRTVLITVRYRMIPIETGSRGR